MSEKPNDCRALTRMDISPEWIGRGFGVVLWTWAEWDMVKRDTRWLRARIAGRGGMERGPGEGPPILLPYCGQ